MSFSLFESEKHRISWCALPLSSQRVILLPCIWLAFSAWWGRWCCHQIALSHWEVKAAALLCCAVSELYHCSTVWKLPQKTCGAYSVQKVIQQCADLSFILPSFQSLILPRRLLSHTDRGAPSGLSQTCWGTCPAAGQWLHFFPLTCSDSLKIYNFNCILQDVFNLSLGFGYSCILSLSGKLGICHRRITSVAFSFLLFSFTYITFMSLWIIFSSSSLLCLLLFAIIFLYLLSFHS